MQASGALLFWVPLLAALGVARRVKLRRAEPRNLPQEPRLTPCAFPPGSANLLEPYPGRALREASCAYESRGAPLLNEADR
jgi:hypothetical protein